VNLLLIEHNELRPDGRFLLRDSRVSHIRKVLKTQVGDRLRAGIIGGERGEAELLSIDRDGAELSFRKTGEATNPQELELFIALPRPLIFKRILEFAASVAVAKLTFINAKRVESSFFQAGILEPETVRRHMLLGMEQGSSTYLPEVLVREDLSVLSGLEQLARDPSELTVCHPDPVGDAARINGGPARLVIGPEGGWTPEEIEVFRSADCAFKSLSSFILRTDNAVVYAVASVD
jgi:RsmE family RNA methyltransferase